MKITGFIWLEEIVQKLIWKHSVETEEVQNIFLNNPRYRFIEKGHRKEENVYGRSVKPMPGVIWLVILFIKKATALLFCRREI